MLGGNPRSHLKKIQDVTALREESQFFIFKPLFMKKIIFILLSFLTLLCNSATAQAVAGGCNSVTVTQVPQYPLVHSLTSKKNCNVVIGNGECCVVKPGSAQMTQMIPQMTLEKFDASTNSWVVVAGPEKADAGKVFSGLSQGKYRVKMLLPYYNENTCRVDASGNITQTRVQILSELSQFLGYLGTYNNAPFGGNGPFYSNEVLVGATTASDIAYTFIDIPETGSEAAYDFGEVAKMNTASSKNYNLWWLTIYEDGPTYQRARSNGWTNGTIPGNEFNLTAFWALGGPGWQFETFHSYKVQFVVENLQCRNGIEKSGTTWNVLERTFFICPAGSGCRAGEDEQAIILAPNPASSVIRLQNFEPDLGRDYKMAITDLAGKALKTVSLTSNEVDISDLPSGMFVASIKREGKRIFTSKFVINQ